MSSTPYSSLSSVDSAFDFDVSGFTGELFFPIFNTFLDLNSFGFFLSGALAFEVYLAAFVNMRVPFLFFLYSRLRKGYWSEEADGTGPGLFFLGPDGVAILLLDILKLNLVGLSVDVTLTSDSDGATSISFFSSLSREFK